MEILRNIPNLQNAFTTGMDSVTAGITQSSSAGASALGIAQQAFSSVDPGSASATVDIPVVASPAEYSSPKEYFSNLPVQSQGTESPITSQQIKDTLNDPKFRQDTSLSDFVFGVKSSFPINGIPHDPLLDEILAQAQE